MKGGCCHWMTLASPGMKVALQPVRGAMHRRSVNPNHHNSSKSKTCRMQGSTKVRSAKTAYKGYPDVNNVKCIKRSNSTIYHHLHNIRFQHPSASFGIFQASIRRVMCCPPQCWLIQRLGHRRVRLLGARFWPLAPAWSSNRWTPPVVFDSLIYIIHTYDCYQ